MKNSKQYFRKATELNPKSELASMGLYLSILMMDLHGNIKTLFWN